MTTWAYLLNLVLMLLFVAGLAVGALWLTRRVRPGLAFGRREQAVRVVDAVPLGTAGRLAVVDFGGRRILIAVSRGRIEKLAEIEAPAFRLDDVRD